MEIYVIRHTAVHNPAQLCYGQSDMPLNDQFENELEVLRHKLKDINFDAVYCSPTKRCKKLAEGLNFEPIYYSDALKEMNFGEWEGESWNSIDPALLKTWSENLVEIRPPSGENLASMYARVQEKMQHIFSQQGQQKVLIITHAGVIRCIWAMLLELPLKNIFKIPVGYQEVFAFQWHSQYGGQILRKM